MSDARPLVRPDGHVRDLQEDTDILIAKHLEPSTVADAVNRDMEIGTAYTAGQKITLGTPTTNVEIPGILTVYDIEVGGVPGSLTLGDGDGDVITLGGTYVSAADTVNLGSPSASGDTILKLRVELTGEPNAGIRLDRTLDTNAYLIAPSTADNPAGTPQMGMIRVTDTGDLQWYNGASGGATTLGEVSRTDIAGTALSWGDPDSWLGTYDTQWSSPSHGGDDAGQLVIASPVYSGSNRVGVFEISFNFNVCAACV